jgi:uncharacterized protein YbjT (DUF2867 family)
LKENPEYDMIVITAPTSTIGKQLVQLLLDEGEPLRVIARDPSHLTSEVRNRVELVQGTHSDPQVLDQAFKDADSVFWLAPPNPQAKSLNAVYVDFTRPACDAFKSHGIQRVVGISALGRGTAMASRAGLVTASLAMDDLIASTGINYRALTMPSFMDNILRQVAPIKSQGKFYGPIAGDRKMPTCATRDIAATAARLLRDTSWDGHAEVQVLGPEDLSFNDMANIMANVIGKPISYQQIPFEAYKSNFLGFGMSEAMAQGMTDMMTAKNDGLDNAEIRNAENTTPTSFRQWCEDVLKPAVVA